MYLLEEISERVRALVDKTIRGVFRSLGDPGSSPADASGSTVLRRLYNIEQNISQGIRTVRSASGSVSAAENTSGLTVSLDCYGFPFVDLRYEVGGAATINIEIQLAGTWVTLESISEGAAGSGIRQIRTGCRNVRISVPTTGIDISLGIEAKGV